MPNWCYNNVKVESYGHPSLSKDMKESLKEDKELFIQFVPQPKFDGDQDWYMWNIDNWGTKWDAQPRSIVWHDDDSVSFNLDTAWGPPIKFYEALEELGYRVTAYYLEEGMAFVGKYQDGYDDYIEYGGMSADEMEDELPEWVNEQFGLIDRKREDEEWEEQQQEEEIEELDDSHWERTEWFPKKVKPVRDGFYEVNTKGWPFTHKTEWKDGKWVLGNDVIEWRGITENQYKQNLFEELDELLK